MKASSPGPCALRLLPLTHSIPESCSLLIVTPEYRVMHTGDWKLDPEPLIGEPTDPERYQALAPVDLVVGDSTNAPRPATHAVRARWRVHWRRRWPAAVGGSW